MRNLSPTIMEVENDPNFIQTNLGDAGIFHFHGGRESCWQHSGGSCCTSECCHSYSGTSRGTIAGLSQLGYRRKWPASGAGEGSCRKLASPVEGLGGGGFEPTKRLGDFFLKEIFTRKLIED